MQKIKIFTALLLVLFSVSNKIFAQIPLSEQANISLLTCGPGEELYSVFGHTAIRVYDPATRFDVVYNFGTFDFDTPNFYAKFVKGDLQYFVSASSYDDFVYTYQYYNRDVFEQVLNLTQQQKQGIANELANTLISDKRFYTYKFIHRNCTTMVADILNKYIPEKISLKNKDSGKTYREIIHNKLNGLFFEDLGINLTFGVPTDNTLKKPFLPKELMEGVTNTKTPSGPLTNNTIEVYKASPEKTGFSLNSFYVFTVIILLLATLSGNKIMQRSFLALAGLLGVFFCFVGLYSSHTELIWNYNILLLNPIYLILLYFSIKNNFKAIIVTSYICIALLMLYIMIMLNKPHLAIISPLLLLTIIVMLRSSFNAKKRLT